MHCANPKIALQKRGSGSGLFNCACDTAAIFNVAVVGPKTIQQYTRYLDSDCESGAKFELISSRGYMMSYDYTAANLTLSYAHFACIAIYHQRKKN
jgi:hypothetical protein